MKQPWHCGIRKQFQCSNLDKRPVSLWPRWSSVKTISWHLNYNLTIYRCTPLIWPAAALIRIKLSPDCCAGLFVKYKMNEIILWWIYMSVLVFTSWSGLYSIYSNVPTVPAQSWPDDHMCEILNVLLSRLRSARWRGITVSLFQLSMRDNTFCPQSPTVSGTTGLTRWRLPPTSPTLRSRTSPRPAVWGRIRRARPCRGGTPPTLLWAHPPPPPPPRWRGAPRINQDPSQASPCPRRSPGRRHQG